MISAVADSTSTQPGNMLAVTGSPRNSPPQVTPNSGIMKAADVVALADAVGSTSGILKAAREMDAKEFIVATDNGMLHKLRTLNPGKVFAQ